MDLSRLDAEPEHHPVKRTVRPSPASQARAIGHALDEPEYCFRVIPPEMQGTA